MLLGTVHLAWKGRGLIFVWWWWWGVDAKRFMSVTWTETISCKHLSRKNATASARSEKKSSPFKVNGWSINMQFIINVYQNERGIHDHLAVHRVASSNFVYIFMWRISVLVRSWWFKHAMYLFRIKYRHHLCIFIQTDNQKFHYDAMTI